MQIGHLTRHFVKALYTFLVVGGNEFRQPRCGAAVKVKLTVRAAAQGWQTRVRRARGGATAPA